MDNETPELKMFIASTTKFPSKIDKAKMPLNSIKIGVVQENPIVGDISGNTLLAEKKIKSLLRESNPDVIVFTEMFLTGYPPEDLLY